VKNISFAFVVRTLLSSSGLIHIGLEHGEMCTQHTSLCLPNSTLLHILLLSVREPAIL
jgi:hypothetical protein